MDLEYIRRKALAAREYTLTVGPAHAPRTIHLRLPTDYDVRLAGARGRVGGLADVAATIVLERALLVLAIVGWSGVVCTDLLPSAAGTPGADEPFAFEPGAAEALLDAQPAWADAIWHDLVQRLSERNARAEAAAKNSEAASTGSDPAPMRPA